jgi:hypothetical protein
MARRRKATPTPPYLGAEGVGFVKSMWTGELNAAAIFADWLEERGDPRGVLLRRRWKRWQKQKEFEASPAEVAKRRDEERASDPGDATRAFLKYLHEKFPREYAQAFG